MATEDEWAVHLDRSAGFLGASEDYRSSRGVIFGVPMDFTTSFRPGTRLGPRRIREASAGIEEYSFYRRQDLGERAYFDAGDVAVRFGDPVASLDTARLIAQQVVKDEKIPLVLGGEHLVSLPIITAVARRHPGLAVLHFDAHADLRPDYLGQVHSHATVMRRTAELIGGRNIYQFGIRSGSREEYQYAVENTNINCGPVRRGLEKVLPELKGRPVYVTIDIDVVDPAFAPGTGTPEPGGVTSREMIDTIHLLDGLTVVGFDLVEVSPPYDPSEQTAVLAALLLREAILTCL